jgi:membrane protein required for colicin V production
VNALDIGLVVVLAAFVVWGAVKGLVRLALGSIALVLGVLLGLWYSGTVAGWFEGMIETETVRRLTGFAVVFIATLLAFAILVWFITKTLEAANLRWVDRLTGAAIGLAVAALLAGAVLVPLTAFLPEDSTLVGDSTLSPYVLKISSFVKSIVPDELSQRFEAARKRIGEAGRGMLKSAPEAAKPAAAKPAPPSDPPAKKP